MAGGLTISEATTLPGPMHYSAAGNVRETDDTTPTCPPPAPRPPLPPSPHPSPTLRGWGHWMKTVLDKRDVPVIDGER
uniref:Uncharacterized protein n=1 Tax=Knipowitschia caucasica TaxID=637954 RepID=A0AAV2KBM5_KNICA